MRPDSGPELRAVPDGHTFHPADTLEERTPPARSRPWLALALLTAFGIAALGYVAERSRAAALEGQVAVLESDLAATQRSLAAHERRMGAVRAHVDDLAARLGLLQEAVREAPVGPESGGAADSRKLSRTAE